MANVKFLTGSKADVDYQIATGKIDNGDVIFTSDTDELIFINPQTGKRIMKTKTQQDYTLQGVSLGALKDGDVIKEGTSIDDLLQLITKKAIPATYVAPTLALNQGEVTKYEVGTSNIVILQSVFQQNDAGALTAHKLLKDGEVIYESNMISVIDVANACVFTDKEIVFESQASYEAGIIKNNNLNEPSPENAIQAGTIVSNTIRCKGYRNLFYTTGVGDIPEATSASIRSFPNSKLHPTKGMELIVEMSEGDQYVMFAYPASIGEVKQITYVQMNDTEMKPNFVLSSTQVEGANGYQAEEYYVYTFTTAAPVASRMTFKIDF